MKFQHFFITLLLISSTLLSAQENTEKVKKERRFKITKGFVSWGYNRSAYTKSDVHIKGEGVDFTVHDAVGKDDPSDFNANVYLNPLRFTIPQFDFRVGVMVNDNFFLSIGWDHMKYKFQNLDYKVSGHIDPNKSSVYGGNYDGSTVSVPKSFYYHEHTDGLNYIHLSVDKPMDVFKTKNNMINFKLNFSAGTGPVAPWTDADMFGQHYRTKSIHFAGWGVNLGIKPRLFFFNEHLYAQFTLRGGYINLWDFIMYNQSTDEIDARGQQDFFYREHAVVIGYMFKF